MAVADVQELMFHVVEPAAQEYWAAVGWILDYEGEHYFRPESDEEWLANYETVLARARNVDSSLLIAKPTGVGGHVVVLSRASPILARWRAWILQGARYRAGGDGGVPAPGR